MTNITINEKIKKTGDFYISDDNGDMSPVNTTYTEVVKKEVDCTDEQSKFYNKLKYVVDHCDGGIYSDYIWEEDSFLPEARECYNLAKKMLAEIKASDLTSLNEVNAAEFFAVYNRMLAAIG